MRLLFLRLLLRMALQPQGRTDVKEEGQLEYAQPIRLRLLILPPRPPLVTRLRTHPSVKQLAVILEPRTSPESPSSLLLNQAHALQARRARIRTAAPCSNR